MENSKFNKNWIRRGLIWGSLMFLTLAIAMPLVEGNQLVVGGVIIKLFIWLAMGLVYGLLSTKFDKQKGN